ncbi:ADP-ribosylglycohydrolase family protein [Phytoactinopolyspora halotolerans]|uniref:ADP-ribosylglycohydrolase family protein n=1 Tax=Phytoactinopolyspora halotolerans TaxID=1981512 RepID=A0A6L9SHS1_9ACTN|nr:ADP-ribosylglycohydrolase family protein [Phytoactinopolyspora halotolerans]NEE04194.1 hypothetical protein [Phytoactinopolyspora halotolerans]
MLAKHDALIWTRRVRGCLLGGALGDALGAPFEGHSTVTAQEIQAWIDADEPLTWTDDTALQLALATYLAELGHPDDFDEDQLALRFAHTWDAEPDRGYGANPPKIFRDVLAGSSWKQASVSSFDGAGSLGNGGAMRVAPVATLPLSAPEIAAIARRSAAITHAHPQGQDGAALVAVAARCAFTSADVHAQTHTVLAQCTDQLQTPEMRRALDAVSLSMRLAEPGEVARLTGSGIAAREAAPAAIAAFLRHPADPVAAIMFAIAMGGDTDTVAAMAGSLAGAYAGENSLPEKMLHRLERRHHIVHLADRLATRTWPRRSS